jgi:cobalt-zinc-cadmium resistance protein CzcA
MQTKSSIDIYQKKALPNAKLLMETASKKLAVGEISYLEWVMLINQSIQIQADYLGLIQQHNESAIEIEKMTSSN